MTAEPALRAPFPYPGGKRKIAATIWAALGSPRVYVEPFAGSLAVLLSRPNEPGIETVNDVDGHLSNVWRAIKYAPAEAAFHADFPVSEVDLHARHRELVRRAPEVRAACEADPRWFDAELAGWWIWGASQWIGGGWCAERTRGRDHSRPSISHASKGVQSGAALGAEPKRQKPATSHASHGVHSGEVHRSRPHVMGNNEGRGVHRPPRRRPNLTTAGSGVQRPEPIAETWQQRPHLTTAGMGVHAADPWQSRPYLGDSSRGVHQLDLQRQMPDAHGLGGKGVTGVEVTRQIPACNGLGGAGVAGATVTGIPGWFQRLAARLRRVRILCGDFERVLSKSTLYVEGSNVAAVFLDPPYDHDMRDGELYAHDDGEASTRAREWAIAHGDDPRLRIILAGLEGEHAMPASWCCVPWTGPAGLGRVSGNRHKERLWLSPHCLALETPRQASLTFGGEQP